MSLTADTLSAFRQVRRDLRYTDGRLDSALESLGDACVHCRSGDQQPDPGCPVCEAHALLSLARDRVHQVIALVDDAMNPKEDH